MAKMRYYLTVVPMTNKELDAIDAKITAALKHNIGTAISTSQQAISHTSHTTYNS
jgi:hypothetical protein